MIRKIEIENFKSVKKLELELGRVTVLIGANGAGKSNILESIAFGSAGFAEKIDNEFLISRGIRTTDDNHLMISGFNVGKSIAVGFTSNDLDKQSITIHNSPRGEWVTNTLTVQSLDDGKAVLRATFPESFSKVYRSAIESLLKEAGNHHFSEPDSKTELLHKIIEQLKAITYNEVLDSNNYVDNESGPINEFLSRFLIYAPENRELRTFAEEGQILPLGIRGEGLFRLLKILSQQEDGAKLAILKEKLQLIDWFEDFEFQQDAMAYERRLLIRDRHLSDDLTYFDQRSANEGFLFLLFYFCLFLSDATPPFFAIDNIDSSLNPKLCAQLVRELTQMAKDNGKQAILTTHNPAVLDGLDLNDPEQKLYVVRRNADGETIVSKVDAPRVEEGQEPVPLSEAFLRGYLGGLPTNF